MLKIYCDGACKGNPGPGGWGAVLLWKGLTKTLSGSEPDTTNNRMELRAVIEALKAVTKPVPIEVYTDSMYVKQGITVWIASWLKTDWNKGKVKNQDLWSQLYELSQRLKIEWFWVKGHSGDKWNECVDQLATTEASR